MNFFNGMGLRTRILMIVALACLLCATVAIFGFTHFNRKELESGIINKQRTIHTQLNAATEYVANQGGLKDAIIKYSAKYSSPKMLSGEEKQEILNQVPIYAALVIGKKNAEVDHYNFRVFSDEPRRKENQATASENEIFKKFAMDKNLSELVTNDGNTITTYRPVRLSEKQGCMTCHGNPNTSPWKDGTDILGHKMENWTDGKLHGVFAISQKADEVIAAGAEAHLISPATWLVSAILGGALLAIIIATMMIKAPVTSLNNVATALSQASSQLGSASQQIASSAHGLSESSVEQASALEETVASMEELSSMVKINTDGAQESARLANATSEMAERGEREIGILIKSINEIAADSKKIEEIISLIDDIAFQTNLLALNAAVEAARAGEQGKGFAVVAEAVRELAQKSSVAARDIAELISGSVAKIDNGSKQAADGGVILGEIVGSIRKVSSLNAEIAAANKEQSAGIIQITTALNQLDQMTQQNSAVSEESAAAAEELSAQAESLEQTVVGLMRTVGGAGSVQELTTNTLPPPRSGGLPRKVS